jgi:chitinase
MILRSMHKIILLCGFVLSTAQAEFKIIGYIDVNGGAGDLSTTLNFGQVTHLNYAFITLASGTGGIVQPNDAILRNLVTAAHAKGVKVLASVGGGPVINDTYFHPIAANAGYRATLITNLDNLVTKYNLDGIDIDWEYPDEAPDPSTKNFTTLMTELVAKFHPKGKLVSAAVGGGSVGTYCNAIETAVFGIVDYLNIMAFDHAAAPHSGYDKTVIDLNYWKKRGVPKDKIVLGVPFYGRNASYAMMSYKDIITADPTAMNRDDYNGYLYNGIPTMQKKTKLAADSGGGVFFWEASLDSRSPTASLLAAIFAARPKPSAVKAGLLIDNTANDQMPQSSLIHGNTMLSMHLKHPAVLNVAIVNIQGRAVSTLTSNALKSGTVNIPMDNTISSGSYTLCISVRSANETQRVSRRIVVMK